MRTLPARSALPPSELAKSVDTIGFVHVLSVQPIKEHSQVGTVSGLETGWGHAKVAATVSNVVRGNAADLASFQFECFFLPGSTGLATPEVNPPLEVGGDYLVFLDHGTLVFPNGSYRVYGGRVWNIGQWESADSREYPNDLSGKSASEARSVLLSALSN